MPQFVDILIMFFRDEAKHFGKICYLVIGGGKYFGKIIIHSQKQSAHWAVDVTAQVVPC